MSLDTTQKGPAGLNLFEEMYVVNQAGTDSAAVDAFGYDLFSMQFSAFQTCAVKEALLGDLNVFIVVVSSSFFWFVRMHSSFWASGPLQLFYCTCDLVIIILLQCSEMLKTCFFCSHRYTLLPAFAQTNKFSQLRPSASSPPE